MKRLDRSFFNRNTLTVAQELLGKFVIRKIDQKKIVSQIVETEAYMGFDDLASHASKGKTERTKIMFDKPGIAYIYMIYGMYYCFNIVTEKKDFPAAVLIRAIKPINNENIDYADIKTDGPGKLCRFLEINKDFNGEDLITFSNLWIEDRGTIVSKNNIDTAKRIGVDYAKHCANYPWRFYLK
ncbi:3-methyladenine DNA glycosylase [bacterium CG_4_10_14_0_2_um_filter_33_32]|nr:MAG: hypothetical protein AUJ93_04495 [bacterium CG2_30_33_46]PIR67994.1 MAG: 3-methyladenine DNA glycosylase [bacterium CG10_big_fil_rev_8_21_14_0_10_33_18]PIU76973.1 MAG: 3-methyladenine DNA glycosylase [bacterium CG06_land_8_20_14_3_00_33_50]PIW81437.1 MAG: 3-methyladenine DNA glycosylase [bacterium CG_4_8_14_3_um_filter_33_28]PIY85354.1 MAG: 3-methyladenine DNA glycosylase [bacterium CG_4_10_14_0_8_um_filter_33_57]PIZ86621.1 MAG: 3-methyladenine DNA glycosylase [bacterium CG_4_10_14_0_2